MAKSHFLFRILGIINTRVSQKSLEVQNVQGRLPRYSLQMSDPILSQPGPDLVLTNLP